MSDKHIILSGAPEGFDATLVAKEVAQSGAVMHIARDAKRMQAMKDALRFFAPEIPIIEFPAWDCLPYDRVSPNADISAARMATLAGLAAGIGKGAVILTTLNAATQKLPSRDVLKNSALQAAVDTRVDEKQLRDFLVRMGFSQTPTVMEPGDYAIRGGIVDIYPPGASGPIRLDFFGDVLDGIRRFDPATQRTTEKLTQIDLAPVSEVILDPASITRFRQNYRIEFGAAGKDDPLYEAVSAGRKHQGMEHWLPLFHEDLETLFDYVPDAAIMLDDQFDPARLSRWETLTDQYDARHTSRTEKGRMDSAYKPVKPQSLYLDDATWGAALQDRRVIQLSVMAQPTGMGVLDANGRLGRNFAPERQNENFSLFGALAAHLKAKSASSPVLVASYSDGARERLSGLLQDEGIVEVIDIKDARGLRGPGIYLTVCALGAGFEAPGLTVISEQDVLGDRLVRQTRKRKRAENFLTETQSLSPGDLVVHVDHGVGRFIGLEVVTAAGAPHECLTLEYADNAKLYLPVENIELLSRYGHDEGLLDKLGGGAWQAKKARLKERIREMAERLIRVAAERALRKAPMIDPPPGMWDAFCARFPYSETDDQMSAIEAVVDDLTAGTPMDRLICGDVGFGKTEVAMRAAFVAAMSGLQVAVIAPTTLLARQHAKSFAERFRGFPLNVR
ncbi:MAG: CarD family transcriptional regulator, partial [Planktomarina sp.]